MPKDNVLEGVCKMRIRESMQLQAVFDNVWTRTWSTSIDAALSEVEDNGKKTHRSNDQHKKLQDQESKDWDRSICQK